MPYIPQEDRDFLWPGSGCARTPGELNYQFTLLAKRYVETHGQRYETLNAVVGALESAKAEFQRRIVARYEDTKIEANGDVY